MYLPACLVGCRSTLYGLGRPPWCKFRVRSPFSGAFVLGRQDMADPEVQGEDPSEELEDLPEEEKEAAGGSNLI